MNLLLVISVDQVMHSLLYIGTNRNNGGGGLLHYNITLGGSFVIWRRRIVSTTQGQRCWCQAPGTADAHYSLLLSDVSGNDGVLESTPCY